MIVYCDYIAAQIHAKLKDMEAHPSLRDPSITEVGSVKWDLDENGSFVSTTKTIECAISNQRYKITVEALES